MKKYMTIESRDLKKDISSSARGWGEGRRAMFLKNDVRHVLPTLRLYVPANELLHRRVYIFVLFSTFVCDVVLRIQICLLFFHNSASLCVYTVFHHFAAKERHTRRFATAPGCILDSAQALETLRDTMEEEEERKKRGGNGSAVEQQPTKCKTADSNRMGGVDEEQYMGTACKKKKRRCK